MREPIITLPRRSRHRDVVVLGNKATTHEGTESTGMVQDIGAETSGSGQVMTPHLTTG